jgi:predicted aspartyl protease
MNMVALKRPWRPGVVAALALSAGLAWHGVATADCKLAVVGELPVKFEHGRVLADGAINDHPIRMIVDTGAWRTILSRDAAERLGLKMTSETRLRTYGIGGQTNLSIARLKTYRVGSFSTTNEPMLVGLEHPLESPDIAGVMGEEVFSQTDVEFDVAGGVIRFLKATGCRGGQLAYWGKAYSQAPFEAFDPDNPRLLAKVKLNGVTLTALLDTGASISTVTLGAAASAGVTPHSPGVTPAGIMRGMGAKEVPSWVATFDTFAIGDETIGHAKIMMADLYAYTKTTDIGSKIPTVLADSTMLLGSDFFRSHRIYFSNSQHMMYFSYNGGGVFSLSPASAASPPTGK